MKNTIKIIFSVLIIVTIVGAGYFIYTKEQKDYNIILIAFDGLQAKHLYKYGYPFETTPNLDDFLDQSTIFTNAISPAPWTLPSFMSIFTSMFPSDHKVVNKYVEYDKENNKIIGSNLKELAPSALTLAQTLKENGYQTAAFTGDSGVSANFGFDIGFDNYYQTEIPFGKFDDTIPKALDWLKENKDKKFFLFLHGYDVHGQSQPSEGYDYRYVQKPYNGKYTGSTGEQRLLREEGLKSGDLNLNSEDINFWRAVYDEKINRADEKFGYFIKQIKEMGLMENTIIVVFSDHGTEFYEHKKFDHGHSLYSELINVLFAVYVPDIKGRAVKETVSTLDIFPTIFGLLNKDISSLKQIRGYDLSSIIDNNSSVPKRNIFSETDYRLYTHKRSIQTSDGWKLIMTMYDYGNEKELYNVVNDPDEKVNLIKEQPRISYELEQNIYAILNETKSNGPWKLGCLPVYGDQCQ